MDTIKEEEILKFPQRAQAEQGKTTPEMEMQMAQFQQLDPAPPPSGERERKLDLLMGISLPVSIELGRTEMEIRSILDLKRGSIIEFDRMASEPVDIVVNGKKMAEGEVVVIDKHFAIRVTSLVDAVERIKGLGK
jgi:flagellar motor switch protein FliN/FliY